MSITKELELRVFDGKAKLNEDVYIYQNDRGIDLKLKLNKSIFKSSMRSLVFDGGTVFASATILKPNGDTTSKNKVVVVNDTITFTINKDFTDDIGEIGIYNVQFHLYDGNDNRITIPPIQFEVKELLGIVDESTDLNIYGIVDGSNVDFCTITDDGKVMEIINQDGKIKVGME